MYPPRALQDTFIGFFAFKENSVGVITTRMVLPDVVFHDVIEKMHDEFDEDSAEYPLVMKGPHSKTKQSLSEFIRVLEYFPMFFLLRRSNVRHCCIVCRF